MGLEYGAGGRLYIQITIILLGVLVVCPFSAEAQEDSFMQESLVMVHGQDSAINQICLDIGYKLKSVSVSSCMHAALSESHETSVKGRPIVTREYPPLHNKAAQARILLVGGIHGDELSSVSIVFNWMKKLDRYHSGLFHWHIFPALNPDGLLHNPSTRVNAHGVDLNRNFNTPNWQYESSEYWHKRTHDDVRRYPGPAALSEPESRLLADEIAAFRPHAIVSVHAPYGVLDFDGPPQGPSQLGQLHVQLLGTYPGSLGNYAGEQLKIPVITIELPYAGIMPSEQEQSRMWIDLIHWLKTHIPKQETLLAIRHWELEAGSVTQGE